MYKCHRQYMWGGIERIGCFGAIIKEFVPTTNPPVFLDDNNSANVNDLHS